jgi:hypothetical protein
VHDDVPEGPKIPLNSPVQVTALSQGIALSDREE